MPTPSKAQAGRGTQIFVGSGSTPTWTLIGECKSAPLKGASWGTEDVSNFDSPIDEEFITTMRNPGEASVTGNRVSNDAGQVIVEAAYNSGAITPFKVVLPLNASAGQTTAGDQFVFNALVTKSDFDVAPNKAITFDISLKKSGSTTYTQGS